MIAKLKNNKKYIIIILILILVFGCFLCYGELGTNREVPKKARYVKILLRGDNNSNRTGLYKS